MFNKTLCSGIENYMSEDVYTTFCSGTGGEIIDENDERYFTNPILEPMNYKNNNSFLKRVYSWLF